METIGIQIQINGWINLCFTEGTVYSCKTKIHCIPGRLMLFVWKMKMIVYEIANICSPTFIRGFFRMDFG